ncbi:hypothetical protein PSACC_03004 [Paramicrosporidium saccamoebae]|uniref:Nucleolar complex-associated protein 3 n=1 Tax=Paramicrosporidium saccamoebae TaxID=1246581 RepID=A0A2H9THJ3_9FUNG|nr:hypothetical protein PSACC_03004 [Paramicrosporidium saccamoebae]
MTKKSKEHKRRRQELFEQDLAEQTLKPTRIKVQAPPSSDDEEPMRMWEQEKESSNALPVMSHSGKWKSSKKNITIRPEHDQSQEEEEQEEDEQDVSPNGSEATKSYEQVRDELASIAIAITEETDHVGKLRDMLKYVDPARNSVPVVRLALLSTLAVIKDILPGYYIRPLSEGEKGTTVSKDIKKIRHFEESILAGYRHFFNVLKGIVQPKNRRIAKSRLPILQIALTCLHELLLFASHFNHFEDVLKLVAHSLTLEEFPDEVERSCMAFRQLFDTDEQGQSTMLGVRLISNMIKELEYSCPVSWLKALETVRLRSDVAGRAINPKGVLRGKKKHLSLRERKERKTKQEEMKHMAEAEAIVSKEELNKWNSESLKYLFRIYFGVLKHAPEPELLPPILAGLARHSHRIGVEYFVDLLQALKRLMEDHTNLDVIPALHCILTVDRIYSINENLAAMDLKFFYNALFRQIGKLCCPLDWDLVQKPLQGCISALFHPKRIIPTIRVAAFVQRMADVSLVFLNTNQPGPAVFMVDNIKSILTHHNRARGILDRDPFGQGAYMPSCEDPDLCNPQSRSLYDILIAIKTKDSRQGKLHTLISEIIKLTP